MKATINGVIVEGTVQEIYEFVKLYNPNQTTITYPINPLTPKNPYPYQPMWYGDKPLYVGDPPLTYTQLTCNSTKDDQDKGETNE